MGTYQLIHLNVVRPLGAFSADIPEAQYFFQQLPIVFGDADQADGLRWHNHGIRLPDNSYLDLPQIFGLKTEWPNNPHVLTMAGWDSAKALHSFTYRLRSHADGMKRLRDWVDRSRHATHLKEPLTPSILRRYNPKGIIIAAPRCGDVIYAPPLRW